MNTIEQIKAFVESRRKYNLDAAKKCPTAYFANCAIECITILSFLDTLSQEKSSEDLEKEASLYYGNDFIYHNEYHSEGGTILPFAVCEAWKAGVMWKEKKMMQKAISGYYGEMGEWGGMCISGKELDNADFLVGYEGPVKVIIVKED